MSFYTYMDGKVKYAHLGTALPAGAAKRADMPAIEVYQDRSTGQVFYRTVDDFADRMKKVTTGFIDLRQKGG